MYARPCECQQEIEDYLFASLTWRPGQANQKHVFVNGAQFCTKTGTICTERIPFISNTLCHSAMCHIVHLRTMTQPGWGNSLGTKQRSKTGMGTEQYNTRQKLMSVLIWRDQSYDQNLDLVQIIQRNKDHLQHTYFTELYSVLPFLSRILFPFLIFSLLAPHFSHWITCCGNFCEP